jgi:hypothetical protein
LARPVFILYLVMYGALALIAATVIALLAISLSIRAAVAPRPSGDALLDALATHTWRQLRVADSSVPGSFSNNYEAFFELNDPHFAADPRYRQLKVHAARLRYVRDRAEGAHLAAQPGAGANSDLGAATLTAIKAAQQPGAEDATLALLAWAHGSHGNIKQQDRGVLESALADRQVNGYALICLALLELEEGNRPAAAHYLQRSCNCSNLAYPMLFPQAELHDASRREPLGNAAVTGRLKQQLLPDAAPVQALNDLLGRALQAQEQPLPDELLFSLISRCAELSDCSDASSRLSAVAAEQWAYFAEYFARHAGTYGPAAQSGAATLRGLAASSPELEAEIASSAPPGFEPVPPQPRWRSLLAGADLRVLKVAELGSDWAEYEHQLCSFWYGRVWGILISNRFGTAVCTAQLEQHEHDIDAALGTRPLH